jgi:hypothetical protein
MSACSGYPPGEDADGAGVVNEIDTALIDHMEFYLLNSFKPGTVGRGDDGAVRARRPQHPTWKR